MELPQQNKNKISSLKIAHTSVCLKRDVANKLPTIIISKFS